MEYAATLPGGAWTDRPLDVPPTLAAVARRVNDRTSDDVRIALLPWAAWLVGTGGDDDEDLDTASRPESRPSLRARHAAVRRCGGQAW